MQEPKFQVGDIVGVFSMHTNPPTVFPKTEILEMEHRVKGEEIYVFKDGRHLVARITLTGWYYKVEKIQGFFYETSLRKLDDGEYDKDAEEMLKDLLTPTKTTFTDDLKFTKG